MQNLSALTHEIDLTQRTLRGLREYQRKLDTDIYATPDQVFVLASVKPTPLPKVNEFLYERFIEERKADLESLPEMIERASLALYITQVQIELAWREDQTSGLSECVKSDEDHVRTLFFAAAIRKESLAAQEKLIGPEKESAEEDLQRLQHEILNVLSTSQSLKVLSDEDLLESLFVLRRSFVESSLKHVNSQSIKIQAQHRYIDSLVEEAQSGITPNSSATWTAIEEGRRDAHRSLLPCEQGMRRIEAYMESFYRMGLIQPTDRDFRIVRYVPAPLKLLGPNSP